MPDPLCEAEKHLGHSFLSTFADESEVRCQKPSHVVGGERERVFAKFGIASHILLNRLTRPQQHSAVLHDFSTNEIGCRFSKQCAPSCYISRQEPAQKYLLSVLGDVKMPSGSFCKE